MSDAGPAKPSDKREKLEVLRAKYHDYCSAQLADLLLFLPHEDIFLLAQKAASLDRGDVEEMSYTAMVRAATAWLAERVALPPFEVWLEDYRAHPERYEEYFMGFWETDAHLSREPH